MDARYYVDEDPTDAARLQVVELWADGTRVIRATLALEDRDDAAELVDAFEADQRRYRCLSAGTHPAADLAHNCWRCR